MIDGMTPYRYGILHGIGAVFECAHGMIVQRSMLMTLWEHGEDNGVSSPMFFVPWGIPIAGGFSLQICRVHCQCSLGDYLLDSGSGRCFGVYSGSVVCYVEQGGGALPHQELPSFGRGTQPPQSPHMRCIQREYVDYLRMYCKN